MNWSGIELTFRLLSVHHEFHASTTISLHWVIVHVYSVADCHSTTNRLSRHSILSEELSTIVDKCFRETQRNLRLKLAKKWNRKWNLVHVFSFFLFKPTVVHHLYCLVISAMRWTHTLIHITLSCNSKSRTKVEFMNKTGNHFWNRSNKVRIGLFYAVVTTLNGQAKIKAVGSVWKWVCSTHLQFLTAWLPVRNWTEEISLIY